MYPGVTATKFGRHAAPERQTLEAMHLYRGEPLKAVTWDVPIPILDQEDLFAQGIDTATLVPGAAKVDALGSCPAQAGTGHIAAQYGIVHGDAAVASVIGLSATDAKADEEFAIVLYHKVTDQTGDPATEWPPTDCGSSGIYVCDELEALGFAKGHKAAADLEAALSLLQSGTVMVGGPWFNSMMEPTSAGAFIDGDGSRAAFETMINSGVAGGHERHCFSIEDLVLTRTGAIDLLKTILVDNNSWSAAFGDAGRYRYHASFIAWLGSYNDYKQAVV